VRASRLYLFFIATYFAQGMVGIAYEPISYLLKDVLKLSASQSATFVAWMAAPFLFKPFMGLITDGLPLGGLRRRPYLIGASLATALGWGLLAGMGEYRYMPTLILLTLVNVGIAFSDVLCDGVMVEKGKSSGKTGTFQAAQIGTLYLTLLATGIGGGWLARHAPYRVIFALTSLFPLLILISAWNVPERQVPAAPRQAKLLAQGIAKLLAQPSFWAMSIIILLFNFSPFKGTPMFYYQNDTLHFGKIFIGTLMSVSGVAGVLGAAVFWKILNRDITLFGYKIHLDTLTLIRFSVLLGAPLTLLYLAYRGETSALILTALFGFVGVIMRLALMDLAARCCPAEAEATGFAIFMSVFNLAALSSNTLGARFFDAWKGNWGAHGAMAGLIAVNVVGIALCWPLLRTLKSEQIR
jgi:predicted MFS family arabinose efflux permease